MQFALKDGVNHQGICREIWFALGVALEVYRQLGYDLVITALSDGHHNPGSLHPGGKAADLRTKHMPVDARVQAFTALKEKLDPLGFDVCFEGAVGATAATSGAHIHIEFDPKNGEQFIKFAA